MNQNTELGWITDTSWKFCLAMFSDKVIKKEFKNLDLSKLEIKSMMSLSEHFHKTQCMKHIFNQELYNFIKFSMRLKNLSLATRLVDLSYNGKFKMTCLETVKTSLEKSKKNESSRVGSRNELACSDDARK